MIVNTPKPIRSCQVVESSASQPWSETEALEVIEAHRHQAGPLLPVLRALQHRFGCVDSQTIAVVAATLNLSRAEVHGVATFYSDLTTTPRGRTHVQICRAEACQARGAWALVEHAERVVGVDLGETSPGGVTLDEVFCLGNCALSPAVMVNGETYGRVDSETFDEVLSSFTRPATGEPTPLIREEPAEAGSDSMAVTVYVPGDTAARSVGADQVATAISHGAGARGRHVSMVRNGSRGMLWLEPLVEVVTDRGRLAYGPVGVDDVAGLLDSGFLDGGAHDLLLGPTEEIPWLASQQRLTFARVGVIDPVSTADFVEHGGLAGLRRAITQTSTQIVDDVVESGLRGRGGAGFPAGIKWRTVLDAPGEQKYVCCNADEGDSGTFADRMLIEGDPLTLLEGMAICGLAVGASEGFVYLRSEYPAAVTALERAIAAARHDGWLGPDVLGSGRPFDVHIRVGAGAYICGEETAMLESLEGKRGVIRAKPPLPALKGLFGQPTVVNNVLTLASIPAIISEGAGAYHALGTGRSRGTQVFQLGGNIQQGGIVETAFGTTLGALISDYGGGTASGRPVRAVQVGGPLGAYLAPDRFDLPMDYEAFAEAGAMVGHGGIVVFDDTVDMAAQARFAMEFCAVESCGKCTPCRIGSVRGVEVIDRLVAGVDRAHDLAVLEDLCEVMTDGSLCAMGGLTPMPVRSALHQFPQDFGLDPVAVEEVPS